MTRSKLFIAAAALASLAGGIGTASAHDARPIPHREHVQVRHHAPVRVIHHHRVVHHRIVTHHR